MYFAGLYMFFSCTAVTENQGVLISGAFASQKLRILREIERSRLEHTRLPAVTLY